MIEELLDDTLFRPDFAEVSTLLSSFSRSWKCAIQIEVMDEGLLSPKHAVLRILQKQIFLVFCNDFESHDRIFAFILPLHSPLMTSQANSPQSFTIARSWDRKRLILRTLQIYRKLMKIATTIIFSLRASEQRGELYKCLSV